MTEIDYIVQHFEERFRNRKGSRIALYPGEYLEEILRRFDREYHFQCVLEPESTQVPAGVDLVVLTDRRAEAEPDYCRIRGSCAERNVPLLDLFGLDQIALHRELQEQSYLTIPEWKELLSRYDAVSFPVPGAVVKYNKL